MNSWSEHRVAWFAVAHWSAEWKDDAGTPVSWALWFGIRWIRLQSREEDLKVRSDREPIFMGPLPGVHVTSPADPDTVTTAAQHIPHVYDCLKQKPKEHHRCKEWEQHHQLKRLRKPQQHLRQEHLLNEWETELAKTHNPHRYVELQHSLAECEELSTSDDIAEARQAHLEKLTKVKDAIIKVVPRTDATTEPLTGRWVDTVHDVGARKARWTPRGYEQTLNGNEDFFSATPAMMHLKMMLVDAALKGHVAGIGDCSGAFYQSPLNPDRTESKVWIEPPPEAELVPN